MDQNPNIILPQPSLKINRSQTREHNIVIFIQEVFRTHRQVFRGFPMSTLLILRNRFTSFFFCATPCHHSRKRNWMKAYAFFLVLPVVALKNNAFIRHFLTCNRSKDCPKHESDQWPVMTSQIALYPDSLSDSAARSCFKKARCLRS